MRRLFKASHANVAIEAGSIAYLEFGDVNVSDELSGAAQGQLAACGNGSLDVASTANARSLNRGRDRRPLGDLNVSSHVHFAVEAAFDPHVPFVVELALKAVFGAECEAGATAQLALSLGRSTTGDVGALRGGTMLVRVRTGFTPVQLGFGQPAALPDTVAGAVNVPFAVNVRLPFLIAEPETIVGVVVGPTKTLFWPAAVLPPPF